MKHDALHRRARRVHSRAQVRRWEYRQRDLAKGMWTRLRRVLADARLAFIVSEEDAATLAAEGVAAASVGDELQPSKTIQVVPEARARALPSHREVTVRLGPEILGARHVVLCPFTHAD